MHILSGVIIMPFYEREEKLLSAMMEKEEISIGELAQKLFVSVPTLRRDLIKLEKKGKIIRTHGGAKLVNRSADEKVPFYLREEEGHEAKSQMAQMAIRFVSPGDTVMLDGSTSAYSMIPLLAEIPKIIVITSSAKSSFLLGQLGITNICTGGRMISSSLSYIGEDAERTVKRYNADVLFFSCRGISPEGMLTDNSCEENALRHVMMSRAKKAVCLCDSSKLEKTCLHNLCHISQVDAFICNAELPETLQRQIKST